MNIFCFLGCGIKATVPPQQTVKFQNLARRQSRYQCICCRNHKRSGCNTQNCCGARKMFPCVIYHVSCNTGRCPAHGNRYQWMQIFQLFPKQKKQRSLKTTKVIESASYEQCGHTQHRLRQHDVVLNFPHSYTFTKSSELEHSTNTSRPASWKYKTKISDLMVSQKSAIILFVCIVNSYNPTLVH